MIHPRLNLIALVFVCLSWNLDSIRAAEPVRCEGVYPHHLQGVCRDADGILYWSFTTTLVKTDARGKVLKQIKVASHHGDLCYVDGRLFVAVNYGQFNNPEGNADNEIVVYQANTLEELARHKTPQVKHGAGGIAHHDGKFIVVGGLPDGVEENYLYEYNAAFNFQKRHVLDSGWTRLGIQAAAFADGVWWFGCYGNILLKASPDFKMLGRYQFDCGYGIEQAVGGGLLTAGGQCAADVGCSGWITRKLTHQMIHQQLTQPLTRIGFGSCLKQQNPAPLFTDILDYQPELFLFMGDNIYGDSDDMAVLKAKYKVLGEKPGFQKLMQESVVLATWDDHDYGMNDGGAGFVQRDASQQVFTEFWKDVPDSPRRERSGVYDAHVFGPAGKRVQIILLDTRYFRSDLKTGTRRVGGPYYPDKNPQLTMLGDVQWQWLKKQLQQPAEVRILVSSIQLVPTAAGQETWDNLPLERKRFLDLLTQSRASGLFVVSGDRHWSDFSRMTQGVPYPLYDFTSSSINQLHPRGTPTDNPHRLLDKTFHKENFGTIDIDWSQDDPQIQVEIVDVQSKVQMSHSFKLSELQVGRK
ncbi:MAG: alkaline phosphatase D family protein [Planctomycetota bacterium]|nr:alkaline phosphatase D family protein [Planctomycetota bacterium]